MNILRLGFLFVCVTALGLLAACGGSSSSNPPAPQNSAIFTGGTTFKDWRISKIEYNPNIPPLFVSFLDITNSPQITCTLDDTVRFRNDNKLVQFAGQQKCGTEPQSNTVDYAWNTDQTQLSTTLLLPTGSSAITMTVSRATDTEIVGTAPLRIPAALASQINPFFTSDLNGTARITLIPR